MSSTLRSCLLLFAVGCGLLKGEDTGGDSTGRDPMGDSGDTGAAAVDHCGELSGDDWWGPEGSTHTVSCDVLVSRGTLTIPAGVTVTFASDAGLEVGTGSYAAGLVVEGTEGSPVSFEGADEGGWEGVLLGPVAEDSRISYLRMQGGGDPDGLVLQGSEALIEGLSIQGAPGCGLSLQSGARVAEGSRELLISENGSWAACVEVAAAGSLPALDSRYTGNGDEGVLLEGEELVDSLDLQDLGAPFVLEDDLRVSGTADLPALLRLGPGTTLLVDRNKQILVATDGGAAGLMAEGSPEAPVTISALGNAEPGYWKGVVIGGGAQEGMVSLVETEISWAGAGQAALEVEDVELLASGLRLRGGLEVGLQLRGAGRLAEGSAGIEISEVEVPMELPATAVHRLGADSLLAADNGEQAIHVTADAPIEEAVTWADHGLPYVLLDTVLVNGSAEQPAILTLEPGVELRFANNKGLTVGTVGGAALVAVGSPEAPILFLPWEAYEVGAWSGIQLGSFADGEQSALQHFELGWAGGRSLRGNLQIDGTGALVSDGAIHHSAEWGVYLREGASPELLNLVYEENAEGSCNEEGDCGEVEP